VTQEEYTEWLFAIDQTLAEAIDTLTATIEDESFLMLWWKDLRECYAWYPLCRCGSKPEKDSTLCKDCLAGMAARVMQ
jgi:hypothetical protein